MSTVDDVAPTAATQARPNVPGAVERVRSLVEPAMRAAVELIPDAHMRLIAGYQLGWCDAEGNPSRAGGKAIRPTLAVLAAEAVGGESAAGVPLAAAVELVHNFSLLHDDIMDRDVERRHRPTGWVAFGEGQAILAGNAMLAAAIDVVLRESPLPERVLPELLSTVQLLIGGQSEDLALEQRDGATVAEVLTMEAGKTGALIAGSLAGGALAAGADDATVARLAESGRRLGQAFQLVDDLLGVVGDPAVTGKSASSDVRAGKRSAPVVAALRSETPAGAELAALLAGGPPESDEDVARAVELIVAAGGVQWAADEAQRLLDAALSELDAAVGGSGEPFAELQQMAHFLVHRVW